LSGARGCRGSFGYRAVNAITNIGFLIAAWATWRLRARAALDATRQIRVLIGLITLTGFGSLLFHTVATR
jgi:hypothetical protein